MNYRIIVSDLDKTLLNNQHRVSDFSTQIIRRFLDNTNIQFVIASGRPPYFIKQIANNLQLGKNMRYAICYNGGLIYDLSKDESIYSHLFATQNAQKIAKYFIGVDARLIIFADDEIYTNKNLEDLQERYGERTKALDINNFDFSKHQIHKLSALGFDPNLPNYISELANFSYYGEKNGQVNSEISPTGINKGFGLSKVCELLETDLEDSIAFGDASNDRELLQVAGYGVAPSNAEISAREVANEVSSYSNDEDFIARYLSQI